MQNFVRRSGPCQNRPLAVRHRCVPLRRLRVPALVALAVSLAAASSPSPLPNGPVRAERTPTPITLDGRLDEPAWQAAPAAGGFLQRDPDQGQPATEPTEVRLLFDDHAIYVGARLSDHAPDLIARQLSRRDAAAEADTFTLYLDPHRDGRTGVVLQVSAAGVQRDAALYDDNFEDDTWDAVWESAVAVDASGWSVEMRVPFSQLRFPTTPGHAWGVNARRVVYRKNESSWLVLVPKNESGLASRMTGLEGIEGIEPGRHVELLPYVSGRAEYVAPASPGDPWNDGSRYFGGAGLDFRYGLGTGKALVGAVNPDFGQVEVDPAVVNLTAFETFFEEKRPFFTEGSQVFLRFGRGGASDYTTFFYPEPLLFYSRRIGRTPQGRATGAYVDSPTATTILGAAKLVGRTRSGWNVGLLEAVTGREFARVATGDTRDRIEVEPLTNYFVGRAQHGLGSRASIGFIGTAVLRDLDTPDLDGLLVGRAFLGGVDGHVFLDGKRDWVLSGGLSGSTVSGSPAAVLRLQLAAPRYYQRPDAPHVSVDPNATSLSGWSGRVGLNKNNGNVTYNAGLWGISPGFEPNDLGYATQTDRGGAHVLVQFRKLTPDSFTRSRRLYVAKWWTFNYGGECQGDGVQLTTGAQFRNYWQLDMTLGKSWNTWDDKLTRGGPTTIRPGIENLNLTASTDARRRFSATATAALSNREFGSRSRQYSATFNLRPWTAVTLSAMPSLLKAHTIAQYLATVPDPTATMTYGGRYVFGGLDQTEWSIPLRVNLVLTPKLSLQLYTQALLSTGDYPAIRELLAPRTYDFPVYGVDVGTISRDPALPFYDIDPDAAGEAQPFRIRVPDFNFKSLRVNAVLRWEFRPGSAAYVVWTQRRQDGRNPGDSDLVRDLGDLFGAPADDVFMVKLAWWLGR
jgi:hypothetical protein